MSLTSLFPSLNDQNHRQTSEATDDYNCIAWAAGHDDAWWDPNPFPQYYWPEGLSREDTVDNLVKLFEGEGYAVCENSELVDGVEKVAIYGDDLGYTHAARQKPDGTWTSKLGGLEDIEHDTLEILCGHEYGRIERFMKRTRRETIKGRQELPSLAVLLLRAETLRVSERIVSSPHGPLRPCGFVFYSQSQLSQH